MLHGASVDAHFASVEECDKETAPLQVVRGRVE